MKKFMACLLAVSVICSVCASADYVEEENAEEKLNTQNMYTDRPSVLKQAEDLGRGLVAVPSGDGILVSWRFLGTDSYDLSCKLYRNGTKIADVKDTTNYLDLGGKAGDTYTVKCPDGSEDSAVAWYKEYMSIPVKSYEQGNYIVDDASVGDLDGDGEYEIVVRRTPSGYFDQLQVDTDGSIIDSRVAYPLIEAYEFDGTHLWTLDIGKNEVNEIDINFPVYDFDGDGKAEVVMRSYDGMTDGKGNKIGKADADYVYSLQKQADRQYLSEGNEYLSVFDGETGAEIARTELLPKRDPLSSWASRYSDIPRLTKRASHFLLSTAYLNGETPSIVMLRGAWDGVKLAAWNYKDGEFDVLWQYDSGASSTADNMYNAGYHSMAVADVDFDGKDEIFSGAGAIDDDGTFMYATHADGTKLGHGDAFDVAKMTPDYDGYYVWSCHETKNLPANIDLHDARTGQVIHGLPKSKDTGRSRAADIDPTSKGWEVWGSTATPLMSYNGTVLVEDWNKFDFKYSDGTVAYTSSLPMNFKAFWDGDLLSELVDGIMISKYNYSGKYVDILYEATGCEANNSTKAVPCLVADIFGDWREEIIWRDAENTELRIYATPYETDYKIPTLMHDITYRECIAWQNNHYNQPANTSFYMGSETTVVPVPEIKTVSGNVNPDLASSGAEHFNLLIDDEDFSGEKIEAVGAYKDKISAEKIIENNSISIMLKPLGDVEVSAKAILAEYNNGVLTSVSLMNVTAYSDGSVKFEKSLPESDYKIMLWDGDYRPLTEAVTNMN